MENEILTGKNVNEAKKKVTDEEVDKILKSAQAQLRKEIPVELTKEEREEAERKKRKAEEIAEQKKKAQREEKEKAEREAKEREEAARIAKEKAEQEAKEREARAAQIAKEKAEQEAKEREARAARIAKEKAEQEAKEREARAARIAKEKAEQEAKEREARAAQIAKEKAAQEAKERETRAARIAKEKAEQETKEAEERAARIAKGKAEQEARENAARIAKEKQEAEMAAAVVEEPYVSPMKAAVEDKERITVGQVIGTFFEVVWTIFKLTVVVSVVVGIVGFLLSRNYIVRGRCGDRQSLASMTESAETLQNHMQEKDNVKTWLGQVEQEKLHMESDDGKILVARQIVTKKNSRKWAVILHGFSGSMEDVYDVAMHYAKEGYNILLPDLRACGESEGSLIGMGWLDRLDVINWIDVILKDYPDAEVVIHGIDMGADTALMLSGEPLKSSVKAIVAEGAYTNAWEVVKTEYKTRHESWPTFPVLNMVNPVLKIWAGYSLKEADATKQVKKAMVPILLIEGGQDTYTPEEMTTQLDNAIGSPHEVLTISTGIHGECRYADPDTYYDKTFEFVGGYVE